MKPKPKRNAKSEELYDKVKRSSDKASKTEALFNYDEHLNKEREIRLEKRRAELTAEDFPTTNSSTQHPLELCLQDTTKILTVYSDPSFKEIKDSLELCDAVVINANLMKSPHDAWYIYEPIEGYVFRGDEPLLRPVEVDLSTMRLIFYDRNDIPQYDITVRSSDLIGDVMERIEGNQIIEEEVIGEGYVPCSFAYDTPVKSIIEWWSEYKALGHASVTIAQDERLIMKHNHMLNPKLEDSHIMVYPRLGETGKPYHFHLDDVITFDHLRSTPKQWFVTNPVRGYVHRVREGKLTFIQEEEVSDDEIIDDDQDWAFLESIKPPDVEVDLAQLTTFLHELDDEVDIVLEDHRTKVEYIPPKLTVMRQNISNWMPPIIALQMAIIGAARGNDPTDKSTILIKQPDGELVSLSTILDDYTAKGFFTLEPEKFYPSEEDSYKLSMTKLSIIYAEAVVKHRSSKLSMMGQGLPSCLDFPGAAILEMTSQQSVLHQKYRREYGSPILALGLPETLYDYCLSNKQQWQIQELKTDVLTGSL